MEQKDVCEYKIYSKKVDYNRIPCIAEKLKEGSDTLFERTIKNNGIYLWMLDCKNAVEQLEDEKIFQLLVSVGDIEPDLYGLGYYSTHKDNYIEELENMFYEEVKNADASYSVKKAINNYYVIMGSELPFNTAW